MDTPQSEYPNMADTRYIEVPCASIQQMKEEQYRIKHRNGLSVFDSLNSNSTHKLKKYYSSIHNEAEELPDIRGNRQEYKHYLETNKQLKKLKQFKSTKYAPQAEK